MYDRAKLIKAIDSHNLEVDKRQTVERLAEAVRIGIGENVLETCKTDTGYAQAQKAITETFSQVQSLEERAEKAEYVTVQVFPSYNNTEPPYVDIAFGLHKKRILRDQPVRLPRGFYHALKDAKLIDPVFANTTAGLQQDPLAVDGVILREIPRYPFQILAVE